jgi:NhaA family Na+:H+ antiporter
MVFDNTLSRTFQEFIRSERAGAVLLLLCTIVSLTIANTSAGEAYQQFWHLDVGSLSVEHWINDGLMAIFFLLIGLELERELYSGELSNIRNAMLPLFAAIGGVIVPALIHFSLNVGTATQSGIGIPMATDIAFALGVLALLGKGIPASLKVFLVALAVIDDLVAIIVIALFYTSHIVVGYLLGALAAFAIMVIMNRVFRVMALSPYLLLGTLMWALMLKSGVHATISGVLLAFAIPYSALRDDAQSPSHRLEHALQKPVAFGVLPIFALANTAVALDPNWVQALTSSNSLGIALGLLIGKPSGILALSVLVVSIGVCKLPADLRWRHIAGAGMLGGIGFTMSIFITNLAFTGNAELINSSKMAILCASVVAGAAGFVWLRLLGRTPSAAQG